MYSVFHFDFAPLILFFHIKSAKPEDNSQWTANAPCSILKPCMEL